MILQNNHELRATGGFITAAVEIANKKVVFRNVFEELSQHRKVAAPEPLARMLQDGRFDSWSFRDANYFPDFTLSANKLIWFYKLVYPKSNIRAVIAVNFSFFEKALRILGSIKMRKETINADQIFSFLSAQVSDIDRHDRKALSERKLILPHVATRMLLGFSLKPWTWPSLFQLGQQSLQNKYLQVFDALHHTPSAFLPKQGVDFFAVIECNFLGLKSNRHMKRATYHDTEILSDGSLRSTVRIMWEHFGRDDFPISGLYRSFVRVFLSGTAFGFDLLSFPKGSEAQVKKEGHFQVLSFSFQLPPQEKMVIVFRYHQPGKKRHQHYRFRCWKQSGVMRETLHKVLLLPPSRRFLPTSAGQVTEELFTADISSLEKDYALYLSWISVTQPLRILSHELIAPDTIALSFSSPIVLPEHWHSCLTLTDKSNPALKFAITSALLSEHGRVVWLTIKDLPHTEERFYFLSLRNIRGSDGSCFQHEPRKITVVYRSAAFPLANEMA